MYPELIKIPLLNVTVKSYGLMMVIGFLVAVTIIRRLSRDITPNPQMITNAALYALVGGVVGARLFYVIHYHELFRGRPLAVLAIWQGGLELLGGVLLAITIICCYLLYHKLPLRRYLDILAIGLMAALVFGRIGCFLNGCCFGKPTTLPWAVRFPYNSFAYRSQINPDPQRNRPEPYWQLPSDYIAVVDERGVRYPKPFGELTERQKAEVTHGRYRCLPVHPTQLYSSANAAVLCLILYRFWLRAQRAARRHIKARLIKPGQTFALMFVLYGLTRFLIEYVRDDNPFEFDGLTISQNLCIGMVLFGLSLLVVFEKLPATLPTKQAGRNG